MHGLHSPSVTDLRILGNLKMELTQSGTENAKETLCRNVLIYGHCRYEDQGCAFNHEPNKVHSSPDV